MTPQQRSIKYVSASVLWGLFMMAILFAPVGDISPPGYLVIPGLDKIVHFFLFAIWTFLVVMALREQQINFTFWALLIGLMFFGLCTELTQVLLPDRAGDVFDFLADAIGIAVVLLLLKRF